MKKTFLFIFIMTIGLFLVSCTKDKSVNLEFSQINYEVKVGDEFTLTPKLTNTSELIDYSFNVDGIIEKIEGNTFKAVASGEVIITAALKGNDDIKVSITVEVSQVSHTHAYDLEVVDEKYLVSAATDESPAVYYKSCSCGEHGTETFTYGEKLQHDHAYTLEVADEKYLVSAATEEFPAVYYKSCSCGEHGTETFTYGEKLQHVHAYTLEVPDEEYLVSAATEESPAIYYKSCGCGIHGTETFTYGEKLSHVHAYTLEVVDEKYLVSAATDESPAIYYKSCSCGEYGTETFTHGEKLPHVHAYTLEVANNEYLVSAATVDSKAVFYKSCKCGDHITETFTYGKKLNENITITYSYEDGQNPTHTATSFEEFAEVFWKEFYDWSGATGTIEAFKTANYSSWIGGNASAYKVYSTAGANVVDDAYFVNAKGNEQWMQWMIVFDQMVTDINDTQSAFGSAYVGYMRLYAYFNQSASYWNTDRTKTVYEAYPVPTPLISGFTNGEDISLIELVIDDGRTFLGWYDSWDRKVTSTSGIYDDVTLTAKWSGSIPAKTFEITNKITEIERLSEYQLEWNFTPETTTNKNLTFKSSDSSILSIDENGLMVAHKDGTVTVTIEVADNSALNVTFDVKVYIDPFIDVSFNTSSIVEVENTTSVSTKLYGLSQGTILFKSLNNDIATIDASGVITGVASGFVQIEAYLQSDETVKATFGVTVLTAEEMELYSAFVNAHNSEIVLTRDLNVAYAYLTDVYVSASDLLFNYEYEVNTSYEAKQSTNSANHGGTKKSIEFVCVHYTAGVGYTSTAAANANYFANSSSVSIHYTTGNDGIYHILDDSLVGFHAGDGTGTTFTWTNTGVKATENVKPVWGVVKNSNSSSGYYFTLNGQATTIVVPTTGVYSSGNKAVMSDPSKCFTYFGPAWKVVDGYYYMGTTWACFTQTLAGAISSKGGNNNSIGIETACNQGSDLWLTYQYTAQLIARLMDTYDLDSSRIVGHNMFSGKDCPQTLLADDGYLWEYFMECVEAEYELYTTITKDNKYTITAKSNNTEVLEDNCRVTSIPNYSTCVTYTLTIKDNATGQSKDITFSSIVHGTYTE